MIYWDSNLLLTGLVALAGGVAGVKLKIPSGALLGALLATVAVRFLGAKAKEIPPLFGFTAQVLIGFIIGSGVSWKLIESLAKCWPPLLISVLAMILLGIFTGLLIFKLGYLDFPTSFLSTSPGAMSAMVLLGMDYGANGAIVSLFHFFRVLIVLVTAPVVLHLLAR